MMLCTALLDSPVFSVSFIPRRYRTSPGSDYFCRTGVTHTYFYQLRDFYVCLHHYFENRCARPFSEFWRQIGLMSRSTFHSSQQSHKCKVGLAMPSFTIFIIASMLQCNEACCMSRHLHRWLWSTTNTDQCDERVA